MTCPTRYTWRDTFYFDQLVISRVEKRLANRRSCHLAEYTCNLAGDETIFYTINEKTQERAELRIMLRKTAF